MYKDNNKDVSGVDDFAYRNDLCRQSVYNEINSGRLESFKVGRRRLISRAAETKWRKSLEQECQVA